MYKGLGELKAQKDIELISIHEFYRRSLQFKLIHNLSRKYKGHQCFFFVSVLNLKTAEFSALTSFSEKRKNTQDSYTQTPGAFRKLEKHSSRVFDPPENYQLL